MKQDEQAEDMETSTNQNGQAEAPPPAQSKPGVASLPLPPHDPDSPIGIFSTKRDMSHDLRRLTDVLFVSVQVWNT